MMKKKNIFLVKFTVVAAMVGFFSPSVNVKTNVQSQNSYSVLPFQLSISLFHTAEARGGRGGGRGGMSRGGASRGSMGHARTRPAGGNINRNVNRNVNVNVNHRYYGGYGHGYGYYGNRAIYGFAVGLAIGSIIAASTMPTTCTTVVVNGISYRRCGSSYYQPFYQGDTLVYQVVASPY